MGDLAVELHAGFGDLDAVTAAVAAAAVKILPGITAAGMVRIGKDRVLTCLTATNPQVLQMVQSEHRNGHGPCRHVRDSTNPARIMVDVRVGDGRWPGYAAEALTLGIVAVLAVRLDIGDTDGRALLLIADGPLTADALDGVDLLAVHAAVALSQTRSYADLRGAVDTRDVIGQAKGVLMERYKITGGRAFALLAKTSQDRNLPLRKLAGQIADTGEGPTLTTSIGPSEHRIRRVGPQRAGT